MVKKKDGGSMGVWDRVMNLGGLGPGDDLAGLAEGATEELRDSIFAHLERWFKDSQYHDLAVTSSPFRIFTTQRGEVRVGFKADTLEPQLDDGTDENPWVSIPIRKWVYRLETIPPLDRLAPFLAAFIVTLVGPMGSFLFIRKMWEVELHYDWDHRKTKCYLSGRFGVENPETMEQGKLGELQPVQELRVRDKEIWGGDSVRYLVHPV